MTKSTPTVVRLEPVSRYLFRRVAVVPALAGMAVCTSLPVLMEQAEAQSTKSDSGSMGPIVSIVTPEYADVLTGDVQILLSVQPRRFSAETVELLVDGRSITGKLPVQNSFKWKTDLFVDGPHTLTVRVTDTQGFVGQAETNIFINNSRKRTDVSAPILSWAGIQNGQMLSGEVKVRLDARDDFGVKYVFMRLNTAIKPDAKEPLASWMTNRPPYEFKLDTSKYADGLYVLDAYAWDAQENEESAPRLTVGFFNHNLNGIPEGTPQTTSGAQQIPQIPTTPTPAHTPPEKNPASTDDKVTIKAEPAKPPVEPKKFAEAPPIPSTPPVFTVQSQPRHGALSNSASSTTANFETEHTGSGAVITAPPGTRRAYSVVRPPANPPTVTNSENPTRVDPPATSVNNTQPVVDASPLVKPESTKRIADNFENRSELPPALTVNSAPSPESLLSLPAVTSTPQTLPGSRQTPNATQPSGLPRYATVIPDTPAVTQLGSAVSRPPVNLELGIPTVVSGATAANTVVSSRMSLDGARIASALPDEIATPPAQTIWKSVKPAASPGGPTAPVAPGSAAATTLRTSPNTNVTTGQATTLDATRDTRSSRTTVPPMAPVTVSEPVSTSVRPSLGIVTPSRPVATASVPSMVPSAVGSVTHAPSAAIPPKAAPVWTPPQISTPAAPVHRSVSDSAPSMTISGSTGANTVVRSGAAGLTAERFGEVATRETTPAVAPRRERAEFAALPPAPATRVRNSDTHLAALTSLPTQAATRITNAPVSSFTVQTVGASGQALPTVPRVAFTPDVKWQSAKPRQSAAIVVSPKPSVETTSFTTLRDESLEAIANRFKMPLSVVAAANGLSPNARIVKGTKLQIPRSLQVSYEGQAITGDVAPLLIGQTSVGAFRFLFEKQGGKLTWDAEKQQVTAKNDKYEVTLTIGSDKAVVNEKEEMMDMAAFLLSGRTMVPIRFFESALNATVEWDPSTGRIYVASAQ